MQSERTQSKPEASTSSTERGTWQNTLKPSLIQRLIHPATQPGLVKSHPTQGILSRLDRFSNRLPLLEGLAQRHGVTEVLQPSTAPIVYARRSPLQEDSSEGDVQPTAANSNDEDLPVVQANVSDRPVSPAVPMGKGGLPTPGLDSIISKASDTAAVTYDVLPVVQPKILPASDSLASDASHLESTPPLAQSGLDKQPFSGGISLQTSGEISASGPPILRRSQISRQPLLSERSVSRQGPPQGELDRTIAGNESESMPSGSESAVSSVADERNSHNLSSSILSPEVANLSVQPQRVNHFQGPAIVRRSPNAPSRTMSDPPLSQATADRNIGIERAEEQISESRIAPEPRVSRELPIVQPKPVETSGGWGNRGIAPTSSKQFAWVQRQLNPLVESATVETAIAPLQQTVREPSLSTAPLPPPPATQYVSAEAAIQRRLASQLQSATELGSQTPPLNGNLSEPFPQVNVDELAEKVLHKFTRQLAIERERRGGVKWH